MRTKPGTDAPVALVTGASSGIGAATARRLARDGYLVAVHYHAGRDGAELVARGIGGATVQADVAEHGAVEDMVHHVEATLGPIELAVCNAGFYEERPLTEVTDAIWHRTLRVLLGGCFHVARIVVPGMLERGSGSIVTVASELALMGGSPVAAYVAAKAAVIGFSRALAREVAPLVRVNVVAPGPVDTPLLPDRDRLPAYTQTIPLGRIGSPEEVADAIAHVGAAAFTTGQVYSPNGGVVI